jgi:hypothetical protein
MPPDPAMLFDRRAYVSLAHHANGRVRLWLDAAALKHLPDLDPRPLFYFLSRLRGVKAIRVNTAALSVVVEYDPAVIHKAVWERLIKAERAEVETLLAGHIF